jgi:4'-phosphopantetheinyl transferase
MRRVLLAHLTGTTASRLRIDEPDRGKPALRDSDVEFNASHTGDLGVIVTGHGPLGVDVESLERSMDFLRFARHSFTEDEYLDISQTLHDDLPIAFFNCWTAKEAYLKAIGLGLGKALKSFSVQCLPSVEPGLRWDSDSGEVSTAWRFDRTSVGSHVATIVTRAGPEFPGLSMRCLDVASLREGRPVAGNEDFLTPARQPSS